MSQCEKYTLNSAEYRKLFNELFVPLCTFSNKYLENLEASKDVVQDVFVKIWENNISFIDKTCVKSYLYTSTRNASLDYLRKNSNKSTQKITLSQLNNLETDNYFFREVVVSEASIEIRKAVMTLPKRCRQIILYSIENLTNSEIAKELDISINTVKTQKKIAYKKLRPLLKSHYALIILLQIIK